MVDRGSRASTSSAPDDRPPRELSFPRKLPIPKPFTREQVDRRRTELQAIDEVDVLLREGVPLEYILAQMDSLGPLMYETAQATTVSGLTRPYPTRLSCHTTTRSASTDLPLPIPTWVLQIEFQDRPASAQAQAIAPIHALLWAVQSRVVRALIAAQQPKRSHRLPTPPPDEDPVEPGNLCPLSQLQLPSCKAFEPFVWAIHHGRLPLSLSLSRPGCSAFRRTSNPSGPSFSPESTHSAHSSVQEQEAEEAVALKGLLESAELLHGLWQTLNALEWENLDLWEEVGEVWDEIVASLEEIERRKAVRAKRGTA